MPVQPIIPPEWPIVYTLTVGQDWPQADEDALRRCAQYWTDALSGLVEISGGGAQATQNVHYSVQAISTDEFDQYWKQYTAGDDSAVGQLAQQCQMLAEQLLSFAEQTEFTKISIDIQIIILLIQVIYDFVISPLTGGLSMGEAFAAMFFTRTVVRDILAKLIESVIMAVLPDLITQGIMVAEGHRSSIDWGEVGQSAQMGLIGGLVGMGVGKALGGLGEGLEKGLGKRIGGLVSAGITGAVTNVGTNLAVSTVDQMENPDSAGYADQKSGGNLLSTVANGAFTGMLFHGIHEMNQRPAVTFHTPDGTFTGVQTGDRNFTLFPDSGPDKGRMHLATLTDDGTLQVHRPLGDPTEVTPTAVQVTSGDTTVHTTFTDGQPTVSRIEQVSDGQHTFLQDGQSWAPPKGSVVTYHPDQGPVQVVVPSEGPKQAVYAGNGDGVFTLVGHQQQTTNGGYAYFARDPNQPVSSTAFHQTLDSAQLTPTHSAPTLPDQAPTLPDRATVVAPVTTEASPVSSGGTLADALRAPAPAAAPGDLSAPSILSPRDAPAVAAAATTAPAAVVEPRLSGSGDTAVKREPAPPGTTGDTTVKRATGQRRGTASTVDRSAPMDPFKTQPDVYATRSGGDTTEVAAFSPKDGRPLKTGLADDGPTRVIGESPGDATTAPMDPNKTQLDVDATRPEDASFAGPGPLELAEGQENIATAPMDPAAEARRRAASADEATELFDGETGRPMGPEGERILRERAAAAAPEVAYDGETGLRLDDPDFEAKRRAILENEQTALFDAETGRPLGPEGERIQGARADTEVDPTAYRLRGPDSGEPGVRESATLADEPFDPYTGRRRGPGGDEPTAPMQSRAELADMHGATTELDLTALGDRPPPEQQGGPYWSRPEETPPWQADPTPDQIAAEQQRLDRQEQGFLERIDPTRRRLYRRIRTEMTERDERVRQDLHDALNGDGRLVGTEHFRKRSASIDEKISKLPPERRAAALAMAEDPARLLATFSGDLNDLQRYTVTYDKARYVDATLDQLRALQGKGYRLFDGLGRPVRPILEGDRLSQGKYVKNFWREGNRYDGLNVTLVGPRDEVFEMQFHTPESYRLKQNLTEVMYKVASGRDTDPLRKVNALQELVAVNRKYLEPLPAGTERFGPAKDTTFDMLVNEVRDRATPEQQRAVDQMLYDANESPVAGQERHVPAHLREVPELSTVDHRVFDVVPENGGEPVRVVVDRTDSGWVLHTEDAKGKELLERAGAMDPEAGILNVIGHATKDGFLIDGRMVPFSEVFGRIGVPEDADLVRLIGCEAGDGEAVRALATYLERPVIASDKTVWMTKDGKLISASPVDAQHDPYPKRPPDGKWKMFLPGGGERTLEPGDPQRPEAPPGWEPSRNAILDALRGPGSEREDLVELGKKSPPGGGVPSSKTTQKLPVAAGFEREAEVPPAVVDMNRLREVTDVLAGRYSINLGISNETRAFLSDIARANGIVFDRVIGWGQDAGFARQQRALVDEVATKWLNNELDTKWLGQPHSGIASMRAGQSEFTTRGGYLIKETFGANRAGLRANYEREAAKIDPNWRKQSRSALKFLRMNRQQATIDTIRATYKTLDPELRYSQTDIPHQSGHTYPDIIRGIRDWQYGPAGSNQPAVFTDQELASAMRDLLARDTPERQREALERLARRVDPSYPGFDHVAPDGTPAAETEGGKFARQIAAVTELVYILEPARHPEAFFTNLMALHLAAGGHMSLADAVGFFNTMHVVGAAQVSDTLDARLQASRQPTPPGVAEFEHTLTALQVSGTEKSSTFPEEGQLTEETAEMRRREREILARFGIYQGHFSDADTAVRFFGLKPIDPPGGGYDPASGYRPELANRSAGDAYAFGEPTPYGFGQQTPDTLRFQDRMKLVGSAVATLFADVGRIFGF